MSLVLRVFDILIWRIDAEQLAGLTFRFENGSYLKTCILGIELIGNIDERGHVVLSLICSVHAVVVCDKADVGMGKYHFHGTYRPSDNHDTGGSWFFTRIVPTLPFIYQFHETLPIRPVKGRTAVAVIYERGRVAKTVIVCVLLQHGLLVSDDRLLPWWQDSETNSRVG